MNISDEKVLAVLEKVGGAVGQTAQHLWLEAIRFTVVEAWVQTAICGVLIVIAAIAGFFASKKFMELHEEGSYHSEGPKMLCALVVAVSITAGIPLVFGVAEGIVTALAPEGALIKALMTQVTK